MQPFEMGGSGTLVRRSGVIGEEVELVDDPGDLDFLAELGGGAEVIPVFMWEHGAGSRQMKPSLDGSNPFKGWLHWDWDSGFAGVVFMSEERVQMYLDDGMSRDQIRTLMADAVDLQNSYERGELDDVEGDE